jgi:hypothetical protein
MEMSKTPSFQPLPTKAYKVTRSVDQVCLDALVEAVNRSPIQLRVGDLDDFLEAAEPWVDRDILEAHLLADGDAPRGQRYVLAFVKEREGVISPRSWTILPPATSGMEPVRCFVVGTPTPIYDMAAEHGGIVIGMWVTGIHHALAKKISAGDIVEWIRQEVEQGAAHRGTSSNQVSEPGA